MVYIFSFENEKYYAEKFGLGVNLESTFIIKEYVRDDLQKMCIPRAGEKDVVGTVTHVSFFDIWFSSKL